MRKKYGAVNEFATYFLIDSSQITNKKIIYVISRKTFVCVFLLIFICEKFFKGNVIIRKKGTKDIYFLRDML
ncbi:hypothetical protein DXA20_02575 [Roseburia sp. AM59-24XD]|nr:hypothetical protein DXA20_02575 [Roseburia sp. AM59-24XD]